METTAMPGTATHRTDETIRGIEAHTARNYHPLPVVISAGGD